MVISNKHHREDDVPDFSINRGSAEQALPWGKALVALFQSFILSHEYSWRSLEFNPELLLQSGMVIDSD